MKIDFTLKKEKNGLDKPDYLSKGNFRRKL